MNIIHFGIHKKENKNSGDTLLFQTTRDLFDQYFDDQINWTLINLWEEVNSDLIEKINSEMDLILIGGGGLFLRDQAGAEKSQSGWQWNCTVDQLSAITTPIAIFAIGYNRFRDQPDFDPIYTKHINLLYKKTIFFGLRNNGSINNVRKYIDPSQTVNPKFVLQHCPTTVLTQIYNLEHEVTQGKGVVSFNLAYDRPQYRFGNRETELLTQTGEFLQELTQDGYQVDITMHKGIDGEILKYLPAGMKYNTANLTEKSPAEITEYYRNIEIAIGMRGHAQMIPFGVNKKILSIVSHNKLQYFLDDIGHPWGVDVDLPNYQEALRKKFREIQEDKDINSKLMSAQDAIWNNTINNLKMLRSKLS